MHFINLVTTLMSLPERVIMELGDLISKLLELEKRLGKHTKVMLDEPQSVFVAPLGTFHECVVEETYKDAYEYKGEYPEAMSDRYEKAIILE